MSEFAAGKSAREAAAGTDARADLLALARRAASGEVSGMRDEMRMRQPVDTQSEAVGEDGARPARAASVLILIGPREARRPSVGVEDCDVLLVERSPDLLDHPGQIGFPGGGVEAADTDAAATALREAVEETAVDPAGVEILGILPPTALSVSNFHVTPVLAWWREPSEVHVVDPGECARVFRAPVRELLDPANRVTAVVQRGGGRFKSPTFLAQDAVIWGFTGGILSRLFDELGWTIPWDASRQIPAPL